MPELRKDPIVGRWVIIAHERAKRPHDFRSEVPPEDRPGVCPFCEGQEDKTPPEILAYRNFGSRPNGPGWRIRVIPNRFPALQIEGNLHKRGDPAKAFAQAPVRVEAEYRMPVEHHNPMEMFGATAVWEGDGRITVLVSHRFSTVRMADLIVVLDGARLVEFGTHDELMSKNGQYAELYGIQAAAYR